jgi:enoyl-CoA hydratase
MYGERVRLTIDEGGVADVFLDRPPANAIDLVTLAELKQVAEALTTDSAVRVVMLRSALEPIFAGGFDLDMLAHAWGEMLHLIRSFHDVANTWVRIPAPTIAVIGGHAAGGGCELALACDFRVMARGRATIGLPEVKLGLLPSGGGTTRLPRLIGTGAALDLLLRGRMIGADEAERIGLITFAADPQDLEQRARDLAAELAALPPLAVREIKRCVDLGLEGPLSVGLALEERANVALADTADAREGVAAFTERRRATFKGAARSSHGEEAPGQSPRDVRRESRHWARDRSPRRAGRSQRGDYRQDRTATPEARGHNLLSRGGHPRGGRPGVADRRRRTRRRPGAGCDRPGRGSFRRHRHLRQQRQRDRSVACRVDHDEAIRPDAGHQHPRDICLDPGVPAPPEACCQPACADTVAAREPQSGVVWPRSCLQHREIRHEHVHARLRRGVQAHGVAANSLWPRTTIATAAVQNLLGGEDAMRNSRDPRIVADAAFAILTRPSRECTGRFFIDDEVLAEEGITDLSVYGGMENELQTDLFLD